MTNGQLEEIREFARRALHLDACRKWHDHECNCGKQRTDDLIFVALRKNKKEEKRND